MSVQTEFQIIKAASGDANAIYKGVCLHCNNNPQEEAINEFKKITNPKSIVITVGLGLGYLVKRLFISSECKIVVYEPDPAIRKFTLEAIDFRQELQSGRVFIAGSMEELIEALGKIFGYNDTVTLLKLESTEALYPERVRELEFELPKIENNLKSNFSTLFRKSWIWLQNGFHKFKSDHRNYVVNILENKFKDKTALVVGAGPSLEKNIEIIKNNRDKFIIFCANVAYKNLISNGITPDFTVYIDAENFLFTIKNYEHSNTNIINHISSYGKIFEEVNPNKFFTFYCNNDLLSRWLSKKAGFSLEKYETKGFASHMALLAAYNMGCNPIILTGQDLAYPGGKFYASGSYWSDVNHDEKFFQNKQEKIKKAGLAKVKGQNGEILESSPDYAGFISHFEEFAQAAQTNTSLINCSTGGAHINGFKNKNLQDVAENLEPVEINVNETLENIVQTSVDPILDKHEEIFTDLKALSKDLRKAVATAQDGLKYIKNLDQEVKKRPVNTARAGQAINNILGCFGSIDNNLFKKWDFSIYIAFMHLMYFYSAIDNQSQNAAMFKEFSETAKGFFTQVYEGGKILNKLVDSY